MQGNVILGVLLPIVFSISVLTLVFLWMKRKGMTARHEKAKQLFAEALAAKNIKIDPKDVVTEQKNDGTMICSVTYGQFLFAIGEYCEGEVFVQFYPRQDRDPDWSFRYPAAPNP